MTKLDSNFSLNYKEITKNFTEEFKSNDKSKLLLLKLPTDFYSDVNAFSLNYLIENGFEGIYISFQRPYNSVLSWLKNYNLENEKIIIYDGCDSASKNKLFEKGESVHSIREKFNFRLKNIKTDKKYVFVDSLTSIKLCQNENNIEIFLDFLVNTLNKNDFEKCLIIVNTAAELLDNEYVIYVASHVDSIIDLSIAGDKSSKDKLDARLYS